MNMTIASRAELESVLLTSPPDGQEIRVCDAASSRDPHSSRAALLDYKLRAARELLLRELRERMCAGSIMNSPQVVRDWARLYCADMEHEVFIILYLTAQYALIEAVQQFSGTLTQTAVYPREVVKAALQRNAAAVVLCHNHPSGHVEPSRADEFLTRTLQSALAFVDVPVLDHLIVGGDQVTSFVERGLL